MSSAEGILVGYDGSPGSEQALSWAAREARSRGTVLTVCHVWALGFTVPPDQAAVRDLARQNGEQVIAEGLRHARDVMPPELVRSWLAEGWAANVLCEGGHDAGMAVVGSGDRGGADRQLGSVSTQVAAYVRLNQPSTRPEMPGTRRGHARKRTQAPDRRWGRRVGFVA